MYRVRVVTLSSNHTCTCTVWLIVYHDYMCRAHSSSVLTTIYMYMYV